MEKKKKKVESAAKETGLMGSPLIQKESKGLKWLKVSEKDIVICSNQFELNQELCG